MLVSPNASTAGTAFIDIPVADGQFSFSYYVQGVELATGSPTVTITEPSFATGSNTFSVVQPGIIISGLTASTTTLTPDDPFQAIIGIPSGSTSVSSQNIRAGGIAVTVMFTGTPNGVGQLVTASGSGVSATATIPFGSSRTPSSVAAGGVAHDPVAVGTNTVTATATDFITRLAGTRTVTINP